MKKAVYAFLEAQFNPGAVTTEQITEAFPKVTGNSASMIKRYHIKKLEAQGVIPKLTKTPVQEPARSPETGSETKPTHAPALKQDSAPVPTLIPVQKTPIAETQDTLSHAEHATLVAQVQQLQQRLQQRDKSQDVEAPYLSYVDKHTRQIIRIPFSVLDAVRAADYANAGSYGDVILNLITEHNAVKAMLGPALKDFPHAKTLSDVLGTLLHEHGQQARPARVMPHG